MQSGTAIGFYLQSNLEMQSQISASVSAVVTASTKI